MRMETDTLPQEMVQDHIRTNFVPLKYESGRDAEQFHRFDVRATPTFIVLDSGGNERSRFIGYRDPRDFVEELEKAEGKGTSS